MPKIGSFTKIVSKISFKTPIFKLMIESILLTKIYCNYIMVYITLYILAEYIWKSDFWVERDEKMKIIGFIIGSWYNICIK